MSPHAEALVERLRGPPERLIWSPILELAKSIVGSYDTLVTLRQLFYRLVAFLVLPNTHSACQTLSRRSAKARREGTFPKLLDRTRTIHEYQTFGDPDDAKSWLRDIYRLDRTVGQGFSIYLAVEKETFVAQLESWFGNLGLPIIALRGYSSQSYLDEIANHVRGQGRPAVCLYAGDFDPSGEDISRDLSERCDIFEEFQRVALSPEQVEEYDLPPMPGKETDSRAAGFVARHGELVQVELEALEPDRLRVLYDEAIGRFFDTSTFEEVLAREEEERAEL